MAWTVVAHIIMHENLDILLKWYVDNPSNVPHHPDQAAKEANINVSDRDAFLMCAMMRDDGFLYKPKPPKEKPDFESRGYHANYRAAIFLKEGGYKKQNYIAKREKLAQKVSDYFSILKYPIGFIISLYAIYEIYQAIVNK